jgi:hypothetical protein
MQRLKGKARISSGKPNKIIKRVKGIKVQKKVERGRAQPRQG